MAGNESDTTPQDRAVEVVRGILLEQRLGAPLALYAASRIAGALADAGLLSSGTQEEDQDGSLRSNASGHGAGSQPIVTRQRLDEVVSGYSHACPHCPKDKEEWVVHDDQVAQILQDLGVDVTEAAKEKP